MKRFLVLVVLSVGWMTNVEAATVTLSKTWADQEVLTHTDLNTNFSDITDQVNNNLNEANLAPSITLADGDLFSFASINASSNTEGLRIPQAASTSSQTTEGLIAWDTDDDMLCIGDSANNLCQSFDGDAGVSQASPSYLFRDSSDNVAYLFHLDTATDQRPFDYFSLWRGTSTGLKNFSVSPNTPLMHFDSNNRLNLPQGALRLGQDQQDGSLIIYSDAASGGVDYTTTFQPSASQTQNTTFTLPVDDGTSGQVLQTDGSGVMSWASNGVTGTNLSSIEVVRKTSDETVNNSSTLQDDDELLASLAANETVSFQCIIHYISGTTPDFKLAFTVPTSATLRWGLAGSKFVSGSSSASNTISSSGGDETVDGTAGNNSLLPSGVVVNSTNAGDLTLQWAQATANASDTKVLTNSVCWFWRQ